MALGVLEDRYLENVPGTAILEELHRDKHGVSIIDPAAANLKKGSGHDSHVILVPQPSDDPRDPLNWPVWKRETLFWTICYIAGLVGATGPLLAAGYATIAVEWGVTTNDVAASNGDLVIALGCIMLVQAPLAVKFGRRPVFIISALVLFVCSIWSAVSTGLKSFIASRVFQGFGMASFEALVTATIGDIYFVHQRGLRVAVWGFAILGGINVAPIVNGYVIDSKSLGWRWCFWLISIFFGIALFAVVLFVPETNYDRVLRNSEPATPVPEQASDLDTEKEDVERISNIEKAHANAYLPAKTFLQELAPWSGYVSKINFWQVFLRPFPFMLSPVVWYAIFSYGLTTCWLVVLSVVSSVVFAAPPYNFNASQTGLVSIGPLVAGIITTFMAGPLCDYSATWFAKRNNGVYEPESRLYIMLLMLILEVVGFAGWAAMQNAGVHWIGPVMMYSLINAGQGIGSTAIVTYVIDVHTKHSPECFALINFVKNVILYGFTQFSVAWVTKMGILHTFGILAGLAALCILTTVPMYIYGKRARSWVARHPEIFDKI